MKKRLFLFAGFDKDNIVDDTLVYYVTALSKLGDIVFVMDTDLKPKEIEKISKIPNVLYAKAERHGEYDFGSYKRAYLWAKQNKILDNYDWLYLVNDSVYGPLWDLTNVLDNLENSDADLVGMTENCDKCTPKHVQSWFVGLSKKVFENTFFDNFMKKITRIPNKTALVLKYEAGLSWLVVRHGFKMKTIIDSEHNNIYSDPCSVLIGGVPFVKKNGASGLRRLYFLNPHVEDDVLIDYMVAHMKRHNIVLTDSLRNVYELRLFGIPFVNIYVKGSSGAYKVYLFNRIPILRIKKYK